jgi:RHS repeat-associated protein
LRVDQRTTQWNSRYTFSVKEKDEESGYGYFGARYYDSDISIWIFVDPMSDKYPSLSPYCYTANNPIRLVDPNGTEIEVVANNNGTYTITGGTQNSDRNIYIMKDGQRTGDVLGQTMTDHSFFSDEGKAVTGAVINPSDQSGQNFMDNLKAANPNVVSYMANAKGGEKYDFKALGTKPDGMTSDQYNNRGMPIKDANGNTVYGSARDVGNYGAGYVVGNSDISWGAARTVFDALQTYQDGSWKQGKWSTEGMPSQSAQRLGFGAGKLQHSLKSRSNSRAPWGGIH